VLKEKQIRSFGKAFLSKKRFVLKEKLRKCFKRNKKKVNSSRDHEKV